MAVFSYIAIDPKGKTVEGTADLADRTAVIDALAKQNLKPVSIKEAAIKEVKPNSGGFFSQTKKVKADQLVLFTRQLSSMIGAGVPIIRALNALSQNLPAKSGLKEILTNITHDIEAGRTLGDSLAKYPKVFDDIYVNMVRAGEAAGIIDEILDRLAFQQEKSMAMRKKIKSAMMYPIVLLVITISAFFGLMIFIVPEIGKIVKDLSGPGTELPTITQVMLNISSFLTTPLNILILAVVIGVLVFVVYKYIHTIGGRYRFHSLLLKTPIIKDVIIKNAMARFARTFSALTEAGVAVLEAISVTSRAVGNVVYAKALTDAEIQVKNGRTLSAVISSNPIFPAIVSQMLAVGEETGQTAKVLVKVADFYEEEVDTAISGLSSIIEPLMIVVMGGMVGLIAASVMIPIASLSQTIK